MSSGSGSASRPAAGNGGLYRYCAALMNCPNASHQTTTVFYRAGWTDSGTATRKFLKVRMSPTKQARRLDDGHGGHGGRKAVGSLRGPGVTGDDPRSEKPKPGDAGPRHGGSNRPRGQVLPPFSAASARRIRSAAASSSAVGAGAGGRNVSVGSAMYWREVTSVGSTMGTTCACA